MRHHRARNRNIKTGQSKKIQKFLAHLKKEQKKDKQ